MGTYRTQLARRTHNGKVITLNRNSIETSGFGRKVSFVCFINRKQYGPEFSTKEPAQKFYEDLLSGSTLESITVRIEDWDMKATELIDSGRYSGVDVPFALLANVVRLKAKKKGRVVSIVDAPGVVARALGNCKVPVDLKEFDGFVRGSCHEMTKNTRTHGVARKHIQTFLQCLEQLEIYAAAFPKYRMHKQTAHAIANGFVEENRVRFADVTHFSPFSIPEIKKQWTSMERLEEVSLLAVYLSLGSRTGEAERFSSEALNGNTLRVSHLQTKTRGRVKDEITCKAPLILKLISRLEVPFGETLDFPTKRFRSTAATALSLAGVSSLEVSNRLGHTNRLMADRFYARPAFVKQVLGSHSDINQALFSGTLVKVRGKSREEWGENLWDWWVLFEFLKWIKTKVPTLWTHVEGLLDSMNTTTEQKEVEEMSF